MPALTSAAPVLSDLASKLNGELSAGRAARASVGDKSEAFSWTTGLPPVVAAHVNHVTVEGRGYDAVIVEPTGTPGVVAEDGAKPTLAQLNHGWVEVKKYPGLAVFSTEKAIQSHALAAAVANVLVHQALIGYDKDVVTHLDGNAAATGTGSTWSAAILSGIANVIANGGQPSLLVMSGADYAAAVESPGAGYLLDPRDGVPSLFGLKVALSAGATAGQAYVLDPTAVTCGEDAAGPYVIVDPYGSNLSTNQVTVAAELFASCVVNAPGAVAKLTVA